MKTSVSKLVMYFAITIFYTEATFYNDITFELIKEIGARRGWGWGWYEDENEN